MSRRRGPNKTRYERICARCEKPFTARHPRRKYCSGNCRARANDDRHRANCIDCGKELGPGTAWRRADRNGRCNDCHLKRARAGSQLLKIQELWNGGMADQAIADELGTTVGSVRQSITRGRAAGLHFEWRRGPYKERPA